MIGSVVLSLLAATSVAAAAPKAEPAELKTVPGAYIVEFDEGANRDQFRIQAETDYITRMEFDFELFQGISIQLDESGTPDQRAAQLASLPAVKSIWPVRLWDRPEPDVRRHGNSTHAAAAVQGALRKRQNTNSTLGNGPHVMTQVDRLHAKGITGKGVKIAVIDSGINYQHPSLGGCFGEGCLVSFGHDLVGDDYDGYNEPVPDDDPDDCDGHGTHVAGIIAADKGNGTPNGFGGGAAPDVTLGAYRVFGCYGQVTTEVLVEAFNRAYEDGADIISASIGGRSGWTEEPWAASVSRIVEKGVPCTLSAGNNYAQLFVSSSAADGKGVASVASFENSELPVLVKEAFFTVDNDTDRQALLWQWGYPNYFDGAEGELWVTGYDVENPSDACEPLPEDTPDLGAYYVLLRRSSECDYVTQAINIASKGARWFILYNDGNGSLNDRIDVEWYDGTENIQGTALVSQAQGESWVKALKAGSTITVKIPHQDDARDVVIIEDNKKTGGVPSPFSSWGPTFDMYLKPQFAAPGGSILSTLPIEQGSFGVLSGTSMAAPFAAAAMALLAEARGVKPDPKLFENLLSSTAKPHVFKDEFTDTPEDWLAPAAQQGAGLIQVFDAAYTDVHLEPSSLSFNDTANRPEALNLTIVNRGDAEVLFEVTHTPVTHSFYVLEANEVNRLWYDYEAVEGQAQLTFSASQVTVPAGGTTSITVSASAPRGLNDARYPYWSGYISVDGSDGSSLSVPYQGLTGSLHNATMTTTDTAILVMASGEEKFDMVPLAPNTTFTLPNPESGEERPDWLADVPLFNVGVEWGSVNITIDVVQLGADGGKEIIGQVLYFPLIYQSWFSQFDLWLGQLAAGGYAPAGRYQFVLRILRIFGDVTKEEDWVVVESLPFAIKYETTTQ